MLLLGLALAVLGYNGLAASNCGRQAVEDHELFSLNSRDVETETGRVVGGRISKYGAHPWQVLITSTNSASNIRCSGAIIEEFYVLTAAHCVVRQFDTNYKVTVGDYQVDVQDAHEEDFEVQNIIIHEEFQFDHVFNNDIALLQITPKNNRGFNFTNSYIQPICLPLTDTATYPTGQCLVAGWGQTNDSQGSSPSVLHHAVVPVISRHACQIFYQHLRPVEEGMLCAGYLTGGVDTCEGDSGGPLICNKNDTFTLYGLVSWGYGCGKRYYPGVYTRIQHYVKWIQTKISQLKIMANLNYYQLRTHITENGYEP